MSHDRSPIGIDQLSEPPSDGAFRLDIRKALTELSQAEGVISAVSPHSDADELNQLAEESLDSGVVAAERARSRFSIYPMSLAEPDPLLAVDTGDGHRLLGFALKLRDDAFEDPIEFTLHVLQEMVNEANALFHESKISPTGRFTRLDA